MVGKFIFKLWMVGLIALSSCTPLVGTLEVKIDNSATPIQTQAPAVESHEAYPEPVETEAGGKVSTTQPTGSASGRVCYPSEMIPAMTAFFQDTTSGKITELAIVENQATYTVELPPGEYIAFAYLGSGAELGGMYSNAVPCGLSVDCTDHTPLPFEVQAGGMIEGIDLCDWYAPEAVPPNPNAIRAPLSGLVYSTPEGQVYWIQPDGDGKALFGPPGMAIPWTGPVGVYEENRDLHAVDLFTGEKYNLTNTPDMVETSYQFEVSLPGQMLFTALPAGEEAGPGMTGGLYAINMDGSDLRSIDEEHNAGRFAASPNGQTIAYGAGETAFLYNWETGVEVFDPRQYGMDSPKGQSIASPAWSPIGDQLAWFVSGFFNNQETSGYGIFDLNEPGFTLLHPYPIVGSDAPPPAAMWSPDGEWLALTALDVDPRRSGVWLVNVANPQQEIFMGPLSNSPLFGPWTVEKKILAYTRYDEAQGASQVWTYDLVSGEQQVAPLPPNVMVLKWW